MATVNLSAQLRSGTGKGPARRLRADARIPAVLYGDMVDEPTNLSLDTKELREALTTSAGARVVLNLTIDESQDAVAIIKDIQRDPLTHSFLHADLFAIDLTKPIEVSVPIVGLGTPVGVRMDDGVLGWSRRELTIWVLPTQIPESFEVDVSELHIGQSIHVADIAAEGFEVLDDPEMTICSVSSTKIVEEPTDEEELEGVEGAEGEEGEAKSDDKADDAGDSPEGS